MSNEAMKQIADIAEGSTTANSLQHIAKIARKAIAETEKQEQGEPVAWMHWLHGPVRVFINIDEAMLELERLNREYPVDNGARKMRPLVFGDTTPQQRKPLTDEHIFAIGKELGLKCRLGGNPNIDIDYARAIEAAHGIKE